MVCPAELRTGVLSACLLVGACAGPPPPTPKVPPKAQAIELPQLPAVAADSPIATVAPAPPGPTIALGREFACALDHVPGRVMCWGGNRKMQLGDGTLVTRATAAPVSGITDAVEVTAAGEHACARTASDAVFCWGEGKPVARVNGLRDVTRVVADAMRTCVVHRDGGVSCWGLDRWVPDRLNRGGLTTGQRTAEPARKKGLAAVVDLALGFNHACMREASGALRCFGDSTHGELGNASVMGRAYVEDPVDVDGLRNARAIGAGQDYTCALRDDGHVACWGENYRGAIFNGPETGHASPTEIPGIEKAITLAVADDHVCALVTGGAVRCFGNNDAGKLGSADERPVTRPVDGLRDAIEIAVGPYSSCARRREGSVVCWGQNDSGQLGNGEIPGVVAPVRLDGIVDAEDAALSENTTCVLRAGGVVTCIGSPGGYTTPPARVDMTGLGQAVAVTAAEYFTCALSSHGEIACWGIVDNKAPFPGAAGEHHVTLTPAVAKLPPARMLSAGGGGACALLRSGDITCWGNQGARTEAPTLVAAPVRDVVEIEQGSLWGCAAQKSGHVTCWGFGYGTEYEKRTRSMSPVVVPGLADALHVSVGTNHACVVRATGRVVCFGGSDDQGISASDGLKEIEGVTGAIHVSAGMAHSCAATRSGEVWCWGWNDSGELGTRGPGGPTPVRVPGITRAVKVAVGAHHSCAIGASHEITCWGRNVEGQITTVTPRARPTPVTVLGLDASR